MVHRGRLIHKDITFLVSFIDADGNRDSIALSEDQAIRYNTATARAIVAEALAEEAERLAWERA